MLTVSHGHDHGVSPNVAVLVPDFVLIFFVFFCFLSLFCNASLQTPSFLVQNSERLRFCTRHFVPELLVSGVTVAHGGSRWLSSLRVEGFGVAA